VAADLVLLETIGEGVRMPKTATTTRVAGPMMRLTFTANALRDPEFRDYLQKKNAVKSKSWTWDIPFEREDDLSFIISEIKDEFGYPIIVMEIIDDVDSNIEKNFGIRDFSKLPIIRHSSAMPSFMYMPRVELGDINHNTFSMKVSEKLVDVANNLPSGDLKTRVSYMADGMRVGRHFLVATYDDVVVYADNAIGIVPEPGMQFRVKDPDSGHMVQTEVTEVVRDKPGHPKKGIHYKVRSLDDGKEITLKRPWVKPFDKDAAAHLEACGCEGPPPPQDDMLPENPSLGYFPGGDGSFFIFRLPEDGAHPMLQAPEAPAAMEPPGYGRFPGDGPPGPPPMLPPPPPSMPPVMPGMPPAMPHMEGPPPMGPAMAPLKIKPRSPYEGPGPLPFPPRGGPFSDEGAQPPHGSPFPGLMPPQEDHGPTEQDTQVFAPVSIPPRQNPDTPGEGDALDDSEQKILDEIKKKVKPKLKFTTMSRDPKSPSGAPEEEIEEAIKKLRSKVSDLPSIKDIRRDLTPAGKPVLFVHTTSPRGLEGKLPSSVNGFEVRIAPLHDSLAESESEGEDKEAADVLVAPSPDRAENGRSKGREIEPGPYPNQVSGPPPVGDELVKQIRDIPKLP